MASTELTVNRITAWMEMEGEKLPVYGIKKDEDSPAVSCWVPSEPGKHFSVHWSPKLKNPTEALLTVDGIDCTNLLTDTEEPACIDYADLRRNERRCLLFSAIHHTDDEAFQDKPAPEEQGEIHLRVNEVRIKNIYSIQGTGTSKGSGRGRKNNASHSVFHESKKAPDHHVKFGRKQPAPRHKVCNFRIVRTIGMFTFGYRPIEVLRADGIAPVCRSNKRASDANEIIEISDDDDDDQDNEEVHRKLSELKAQTEELQKSIKRPRKRIKVEDGRLANNQGREH